MSSEDNYPGESDRTPKIRTQHKFPQARTNLNGDVLDLEAAIIEKKLMLCKARDNKSEDYVMLEIVEYVVSCFDLWKNSSKSNSETTFRKRFGRIFELLFANTNIKASDEECTAYPRKNNILLKLNDDENVDLCISEWHKENTILSQHSMNHRLNACILSHLAQNYGLKETLAMNWVGEVVYMYKIEDIDNVFVAEVARSFNMPIALVTLHLFEDILDALFKFRNFMINSSSVLKGKICLKKNSEALDILIGSSSPSSSSTVAISLHSSDCALPLVFFKQNYGKKRKADQLDEEE